MKDEEEIPTTNSNDIEGLINRFEGDQMREGDKAMIARLLKMWLVMLRLMDKPKTTLDKVRQALFGRRANKGSKSDSDKGNQSTSQTSSQTDKSASYSSQAKQSTVTDAQVQGEVKKKRRGHATQCCQSINAAPEINWVVTKKNVKLGHYLQHITLSGNCCTMLQCVTNQWAD
jgi:hypothetical protein